MLNVFTVGCSDSEVYSGDWRTENYVIVTLLGVIAFLIFLGTIVDIREINSKHVGYQIVKAFSLRENIKFIFDVPTRGGSGRFDCLEGMRSLRKFTVHFILFHFNQFEKFLILRK